MKKILKTISLVISLLMIFTFVQKDTRATNEFIIEDSTKTLTRYTGTASTVVVPDTIENIAANAFVNNTSLVSVQLPTSLKTIGNSAFEGCTNLTTVEFSGVIENLETIGDRAFYGCNQLSVNWVIRNRYDSTGMFRRPTVSENALQPNNHNFIILCRDEWESWTGIDNLYGTYYKGVEKPVVVYDFDIDEYYPIDVYDPNESMGGIYDPPTLDVVTVTLEDEKLLKHAIDLSQYFTVYSWTIKEKNEGINTYEQSYDRSLYQQFNVPTELPNTNINYTLGSDPWLKDQIPSRAYVVGSDLVWNNQRADLYVYISTPNQSEIPAIYFPINGVVEGSVGISQMPNKTTYYEGEIFDPTGIEVSMTDKFGDIHTFGIDDEPSYFRGANFLFYTNNTNPWDPMDKLELSVDDRYVYLDFYADAYDLGIGASLYKAEILIEVLKISATDITITETPKKLNYFEGDKFDPTGLKIHVKNNDGSEEDVTYDDSTKDKFSFPSDPLQTSDTEVEITYDGQKVKQEVKVSPVEISSIVVKDNPQLEYYAGDYFDPTGLTLTVHYNNGTTQDITYSEATKNDFKFSLEQLKATDTEIKITYQDHEATLGLTVHPFLLERIEIKQKPTLLEYYAEDHFDPTGLIITAYYNNGDSEDITYAEDTKNKFSFSVDQLKDTDTEVEIDYQGKKIIQKITVHPLLIETVNMKSQPTQLEYYEEDIFNPSGLVMSIKYNSGRTKDVSYSDATKTDFIFSLNELSIDNHEIEITYQSYSFTLPITVKERYTKDKVEKDIVEIEGQFEENAYLVIENKAFHEAGNLLNDKDILGSYEVSVIGKYRGELKLTFEIGTEHNGKTVYILHQKQNGRIEKFEEVVKDGKVMITVNELSPFIIYMDQEKTDISNTENNQEVVPPVINPIEPPLSNINNELNTNTEPLTTESDENKISTSDHTDLFMWSFIGIMSITGAIMSIKRKRRS